MSRNPWKVTKSPPETGGESCKGKEKRGRKEKKEKHILGRKTVVAVNNLSCL